MDQLDQQRLQTKLQIPIQNLHSPKAPVRRQPLLTGHVHERGEDLPRSDKKYRVVIFTQAIVRFVSETTRKHRSELCGILRPLCLPYHSQYGSSIANDFVFWGPSKHLELRSLLFNNISSSSVDGTHSDWSDPVCSNGYGCGNSGFLTHYRTCSPPLYGGEPCDPDLPLENVTAVSCQMENKCSGI